MKRLLFPIRTTISGLLGSKDARLDRLEDENYMIKKVLEELVQNISPEAEELMKEQMPVIHSLLSED